MPKRFDYCACLFGSAIAIGALGPVVVAFLAALPWTVIYALYQHHENGATE